MNPNFINLDFFLKINKHDFKLSNDSTLDYFFYIDLTSYIFVIYKIVRY